MIDEITDHAQQAKNRLPRHLDGATQFNALIDILGSRIQGLETELFNLLDERFLTVAVGVQLDGLGQILDLDREVGQSDAAYRQALIGVTGQLSLSGQIEPLITVFDNLTSAAFIFISEFYPAGVLMVAHYDADAEDPVIDVGIVEAMAAAKAAGVELDLRYAEQTTYLELADISEIDGSGNGPSSADHGLGDETLTEGGGLARKL